MREIQDALLRLIRAGLEAKQLQEGYLNSDLNDNVPFSIYGNIIDAIYYLVGEKTSTLEESVTYTAMTVKGLSESVRLKLLTACYNVNHPAQPEPTLIEREEMRKRVRENGGYMSPEGDWK